MSWPQPPGSPPGSQQHQAHPPWDPRQWTLGLKVAAGVVIAMCGFCCIGALGGKRNQPAGPTPEEMQRGIESANRILAQTDAAADAARVAHADPTPSAGPAPGDQLAAFVRAHAEGATVRAVAVEGGRGTITLSPEEGETASMLIHRATDALRALVVPDLWTQHPSLQGVQVRVERGPHFVVTRVERGAQAVLDTTSEASPEVAQDLRRRVYWGAAGRLPFLHQEACPDGLWALFTGDTPGRDEFQRRENEQHRAEIAARLRGAMFTTTINTVAEIQLGDYSFTSHSFPLTLFPDGGTVECRTSTQPAIIVAFGPARVVDPLSQPGDRSIGFLQWRIAPLRFNIPVAEADAPAFRERNRNALHMQVGWRIGSTRVDRRMVREPGNPELQDHGAGRLIVASDVHVRVYNSQSEEIVLDNAPLPASGNR